MPVEKSKCCTCGYEWPTGQHGGHSCTDHLLDEIDRLKRLIPGTKERRVMLTYEWVNTYEKRGISACYRDVPKNQPINSDWLMEKQRELNKITKGRSIIKIISFQVLED